MNALTQIKPADDIQTFLPNIGPDEYELRAKLRSYRNVSAAMIAATESDTARQLAWMAQDWATRVIYEASAAYALPEINRLCKRLLLTAMQAEQIEVLGVAA